MKTIPLSRKINSVASEESVINIKENIEEIKVFSKPATNRANKLDEIGIQVDLLLDESNIEIVQEESEIFSGTDKYSTFEKSALNDVRSPPQIREVRNIKLNLMNTKSKLKIRKKSPKSNDDIFPEITSSDRRNIRKVREYEHKFFKSSDNGKCISPKASIKKEKFSDYVKTNTGYYNGSMSPVIQKQKEFSPILKRKRSNVVFDSIDLFQVFDKYQKSNGGNTFKNKDEKEYIALTGKTIEFL